jgi:hypothetical protein
MACFRRLAAAGLNMILLLIRAPTGFAGPSRYNRVPRYSQNGPRPTSPGAADFGFPWRLA